MWIYYGAIVLALLLLAGWNVYNKKYQINSGSGIRACFFLNAVNGWMTAGIFWIVGCFLHGGIHFAATPYSLFHALLQSLLGGGYMVLGLWLMSRGKLTVYTVFLMLGGMLLPYLYGLFFLNETATAGKIVGCVLLTALLIVFSAGEKGDRDRPVTPVFLLLCSVVFLLNGALSIVSKIHQISALPKVDTNDFVVLSNAAKGLLFTAVLPFLSKEKDLRPRRQKQKAIFYIFMVSAVGGFSSLCQLFAATKLDASIQYPVISGGMMVLSALSGRIFFRERLSRRSTVCLLLIFAATFLFLF